MTGKGRRIALLVLLLALVLGIGGFVLLVSEEHPGGVQPTAQPSGEARVEIGTNRLVAYSPTGEMVFQAEMQRAEYDKRGEVATLWGVNCSLMENGRPVTAVEAERLQFFLRENRGLFGGTVRMWSEAQKTEIKCQDVSWEVEEKRVWSDRPAEFKRGNLRMEGNRLEADIALRKVSLYDGARFETQLKGHTR